MEWWVYPGEDELREWRCCGLGGDGVRRMVCGVGYKHMFFGDLVTW